MIWVVREFWLSIFRFMINTEYDEKWKENIVDG